MNAFKKELKHLSKDPVLAAVIKSVPAPDHSWNSRRTNHFKSLVVAIVNQQLSGKAAATILKRFVALFPGKKFPTPDDVLAMSPAKMRKCGLSAMKVSFLKDLARNIKNGQLNFRAMKGWTDEEVIEHLVNVKGIGRWTAEMFLMFSLGRPDVFSYGDLGLRNAMKTLYTFKEHPTQKQAEKISAAWSPYRTLASRYLWASVDSAFRPEKKKGAKKK